MIQAAREDSFPKGERSTCPGLVWDFCCCSYSWLVYIWYGTMRVRVLTIGPKVSKRLKKCNWLWAHLVRIQIQKVPSRRIEIEKELDSITEMGMENRDPTGKIGPLGIQWQSTQPLGIQPLSTQRTRQREVQEHLVGTQEQRRPPPAVSSVPSGNISLLTRLFLA